MEEAIKKLSLLSIGGTDNPRGSKFNVHFQRRLSISIEGGDMKEERKTKAEPEKGERNGKKENRKEKKTKKIYTK